MITFYCILYVSVLSFISHLVENHKHDMPGVGFPKKFSYIMNRLDVLGCLIVLYRLVDLYITKYGYFKMKKYTIEIGRNVKLLPSFNP